MSTEPISFPDPASPEGQRWAAAAFPADGGVPQIPAAPAPAAPAFAAGDAPSIGSVCLYTSHDPYAQPARDRTQVILVTALEDDGDGGTRVRGLALGYADAAASFTPGQLIPA